MAATIAQALCEGLLTISLFVGTTVLFTLVCEAVRRSWQDTHTH